MIEQYKYWIFDLDGTLTRPIFDFPKIKRSLGLPADRGILEVLAEMEQKEAEEIALRLEAIEFDLAGKAQIAEGVAPLLAGLKDQGSPCGILTRNKKHIALHTLEAIGMMKYFREEDVLGRDEAAHKPSPDGVHLLLERWGAHSEEAVMVGDYLFDLTAAEAAGVDRIYVDDSAAFPHRAHANHMVVSLAELLRV